MKGLESYTHIFIFTLTCTPRSLVPGYKTPESFLCFHKAILGVNFPATTYILKNDRRKENRTWENTLTTSAMYLKT